MADFFRRFFGFDSYRGRDWVPYEDNIRQDVDIDDDPFEESQIYDFWSPEESFGAFGDSGRLFADMFSMMEQHMKSLTESFSSMNIPRIEGPEDGKECFRDLMLKSPEREDTDLDDKVADGSFNSIITNIPERGVSSSWKFSSSNYQSSGGINQKLEERKTVRDEFGNLSEHITRRLGDKSYTIVRKSGKDGATEETILNNMSEDELEKFKATWDSDSHLGSIFKSFFRF